MQTLLSRFCEEFVTTIQPLLAPLDRTADLLENAPANTPARSIKTPLAKLRRDLQQLSDKVTEQQAYVLIFGPLKSGKSTMMNAIAGSYVSEVSSLPAYPCMVFVSDETKRSYRITRFNGKTEEFADVDALNKAVERAHGELAASIRECEDQGKSFDPGVHHDDAISRIDVHAPTDELSSSRAILVDTPGLYSKMKFGYDRMTRDFRNTAACAVFVVRSDNLFLEQVFSEFTELLELFSRIFLVVNIDSTKRDLGPDGELVPSLEQRDPGRVVEAFEKLAMSAPLREAADQGRLSIYPIDLLHAARDRMSTAKDKPADSQNQEGFKQFYGDLTHYLDSSEYIVAFLGDSMRMANSLLADAKELCKHEDIEHLRGRINELEQQLEVQEARRHALERLESAGWTKKLERLADKLATACGSLATDISERTSQGVTDLVKGWFRSKKSLNDLVKKDLDGLFTQYQEELIATVSKELSERLVKNGVGIDLSDQAAKALAIIEIDLTAISRAAHGKTDRQALVAVPPTPLRTDHFRLRRGFLDWILLRGQASVRRRLFGPAEKPDRAIQPEEKLRRLGDAGLAEMRRRMEAYKRGFFAETETRIVAGFAHGYCKVVLDELTGALRSRRADVEEQLHRINGSLADARGLLAPLEDITKQTETTASALEQLTTHYQQLDLFMLTKPVAAKPAAAEQAKEAPKPKDKDKSAEPTKAEPKPRAKDKSEEQAKAAPKPRAKDKSEEQAKETPKEQAKAAPKEPAKDTPASRPVAKPVARPVAKPTENGGKRTPSRIPPASRTTTNGAKRTPPRPSAN